jgi:hypothetical protein
MRGHVHFKLIQLAEVFLFPQVAHALWAGKGPGLTTRSWPVCRRHDSRNQLPECHRREGRDQTCPSPPRTTRRSFALTDLDSPEELHRWSAVN